MLGSTNIRPVRQSEAIFQRFATHRFENGGDFFSTRAEIVDGIGMRALNEFCQHIRHAKLPNDLKCAVIHELSHGVTLCADGAASNLAMCARNFFLKTGGLSAAQRHQIHDGILIKVYPAIVSKLTDACLLTSMAETAFFMFKSAITLPQETHSSEWFPYIGESQHQMTHTLEMVREQFDAS